MLAAIKNSNPHSLARWPKFKIVASICNSTANSTQRWALSPVKPLAAKWKRKWLSWSLLLVATRDWLKLWLKWKLALRSPFKATKLVIGSQTTRITKGHSLNLNLKKYFFKNCRSWKTSCLSINSKLLSSKYSKYNQSSHKKRREFRNKKLLWNNPKHSKSNLYYHQALKQRRLPRDSKLAWRRIAVCRDMGSSQI